MNIRFHEFPNWQFYFIRSLINVIFGKQWIFIIISEVHWCRRCDCCERVEYYHKNEMSSHKSIASKQQRTVPNLSPQNRTRNWNKSGSRMNSIVTPVDNRFIRKQYRFSWYVDKDQQQRPRFCWTETSSQARLSKCQAYGARMSEWCLCAMEHLKNWNNSINKSNRP